MNESDTAAQNPRARFWVIETGPLAFVLAWVLIRDSQRWPWQLAAAVAGGVALSAGGVMARRHRLTGALLVTAGLAMLILGVAPEMTTRPLKGFILLLLSIAIVARIWTPEALGDLIGARASRLQADVVDIRLASAMALATWLFGVGLQDELDVWIAGASALASVLAGWRALAWGRSALPGGSQIFWAALVVSFALTAGIATAMGMLVVALTVLALMPVTALLLARIGAGVRIVDASWTGLVLGHPARLVVATFLLLCVVGFALLSLPISAAGETAMGRIDALFTAVSAVCVTGLITVDTPTAWSPVGQGVILLLIQLGGLGIMTLSTAALGLFGRRLSVRHEEAVASLLSSTHRGFLFVVLRRTLIVTFVFEIAGAFCLALLFWAHGDGAAEALSRGLFTAISAFCNAGFALQTDSLLPYQASPAVLHTIAILIIAGGLSPAVIVALPRFARQQVVPLQVKIILAASVGLLIFGFVMFGSFEWNNSLAGLSFGDRLHNAWFQSVTFRTAGFNSVDFAALRASTLLISLLLMFVGGAPGGTAGGIKVTTAWVLAATVEAVLRGRRSVSSFGRRIADEVVYRTVAITAIGSMVLVGILCAVLLTQDISPILAVFETFSAIGTVGLSIGGTANLDGLGKVIIMIAMFLGRVGPLTVFLLLVERQRGSAARRLEENLEVG